MKDPVNVFLIVLLLQMSYIDLTMLTEEQNKVLRYCSIAELLIEVDVHVPQHVCSGDIYVQCMYYTSQIDAMLPCICSVTDLGGHQNVVGTIKIHTSSKVSVSENFFTTF